MRISIASTEFLSTGSYASIDADFNSETGALEARVSRRMTLDGGCVINHGGVSQGDRVLSISGKITAAEEAVLYGIMTTQVLVHLSCDKGYFTGVIRSIRTDAGALKLTFWVKERLDA